MEAFIFFGLLIGLPVLLVSGILGMVLTNPKDRKEILGRAKAIVRAHILSGKSAKEISGGVSEKEILSNWDNQFQGKDLVVKENQKTHEIVKTRMHQDSFGVIAYKWWCRCGAWHVSQDAPMRVYHQHLNEQKKIDAQRKKAEEFRKKGLDREW